MSRFFLKAIPILIFWGALAIVILQVPYPNSLTQISLNQIILFFIPFFLAIAFTINLLLINTPISFSISLGIIFLLILKALDSLNLVTAILITIPIVLLVSYFRKIKRRSLTKLPKISKLTHLHKRNVSS